LVSQGNATHVKTLITQSWYLDSRLHLKGGKTRSSFTLRWYCGYHLLGGFVNAANNAADCNAEYYTRDCAPRPGMPDFHLATRVFIRAKRDIYADEEILVSYGNGYWNYVTHFNDFITD
jgi:hypothetical protein